MKGGLHFLLTATTTMMMSLTMTMKRRLMRFMWKLNSLKKINFVLLLTFTRFFYDASAKGTKIVF